MGGSRAGRYDFARYVAQFCQLIGVTKLGRAPDQTLACSVNRSTTLLLFALADFRQQRRSAQCWRAGSFGVTAPTLLNGSCPVLPIPSRERHETWTTQPASTTPNSLLNLLRRNSIKVTQARQETADQ